MAAIAHQKRADIHQAGVVRMITGYKLQAASGKPQTAGYKRQAASCKPHAAGYKLQAASCYLKPEA